nr:hypothetical protein [uncultured Psychroserpens sp.]
MKQLLFILSLSFLVVSCENESLNSNEEIANNDFVLDGYNYNKNVIGTELSFENHLLNLTFLFNTENQVALNNIQVAPFYGEEENIVQTIVRNNDGLITELNSTANGVLIRKTIVSYYPDNKISQIEYEEFEDINSDSNYILNFTHDGNITTRHDLLYDLEVITTFTFDSNGLLLERRLDGFDFQGAYFIRTYNYDNSGNLLNLTDRRYDVEDTLTSELIYSFTYDSTINPLKHALDDDFNLSIFLRDYFSTNRFEIIDHKQVFHKSPNNVTSTALTYTNFIYGTTVSDGPRNLTIEYDTEDRIISRSGKLRREFRTSLDFAGIINLDETFSYLD